MVGVDVGAVVVVGEGVAVGAWVGGKIEVGDADGDVGDPVNVIVTVVSVVTSSFLKNIAKASATPAANARMIKHAKRIIEVGFLSTDWSPHNRRRCSPRRRSSALTSSNEEASAIYELPLPLELAG